MLELRLAYVLCNLGLLSPAAELTCAALAHARALEEPALLAQALAVSVMLDFHLGRGLDEARLAEALELEDRDQRMAHELQPSLDRRIPLPLDRPLRRRRARCWTR